MTRISFIVCVSLVLLGGCTTVSEAGYYWGNYAQTSYLIVNEPTDESYRAHIEELTRIIDVSKKQGLKVPPGVYAEIGFMHGKLGEEENAKAFFALEVQEYPESEAFLVRFTDGAIAGGGASREN